MIPLKIQIKNFLSYGSETQEIDFEPYNLICLSGKNGHGKSALLDAMSWAVWGQARKISGTSKPDQGLLRLGQRQMLVVFDFEFNKNKYRVRREFTDAYGKAYAYLEFGIFENEDQITSLTDKTIRATQEKIENMIGLNFDAFINSAFLRQGSSNEFSKKSAKERKEILASILGLDKYENLRKIALEKIKISLNEKDTLLKLALHIETDVKNVDETVKNLEIVNEQIEDIKKNESTIFNEKTELEKQKNLLSSKLQEKKILQFQFQKNNEELLQRIDHVKNVYKTWKETHRKKINLCSLNELKQKRVEFSKKLEELQKNLEDKLNVKDNLLKAKEEQQIFLNKMTENFNVLMQEKKIEIEKSILSKNNLIEQSNLKNKTKNEFCEELNKIESELNKVKLANVDEDLLIKDEKLFEKRKNYYQKYIAQANLIKNELLDLEKKKKLSFDELNPSCPLCEQNLSASRKKFLKIQFSKRESFLKHRLKRLSKIVSNLKEDLLVQHEDIKIKKHSIEQNNILRIKIEEFQKNKQKIKNQISDIENEIKTYQFDINKLNGEILEKQKNLEAFTLEQKNLIESNNYYIELKSKIEELTNKLNSIEYDSQIYKQISSELEQIDVSLSVYSNLSEINKIQEQRKAEIANLCATSKLLKEEINQLKDKISTLDNLEDSQKQIEKEEEKIVDALKNLLKQKEDLLHQKGSLENQKLKLESLAQDLKAQKKVLQELDEIIEEYKAISVALSKDGIQALLIEDAIPEIESEANDLLSKLTDNQAQIFIESLRDLKKGGTKETLDIKISDGIGIRPYEMFSGGEAFRIDFALRIAISKLLARRAGTSLQTLIIDEGFGSQDEEGLANIMDAIYKIQEDFSKIIIVSHLSSMKDQFPVHFFVEKSPSGSKVKVIEQG